MEKPLENRSVLSQLGLLLFIWTGLMLVFPFVNDAITFAITGKHFQEAFPDEHTVQTHVWFFRTTQSAYTILVYLFPALFSIGLSKQQPLRFLGIDRLPGIMLIIVTLCILGFSIPFVVYTAEMNEKINLGGEMNDAIRQFEHASERFQAILMNMNTIWVLLFNLFMFAFLPAVCEEFFFRGVLQRLVGRLMQNGHAAVMLTAILFSTMHEDFHGFIPRAVLGVILGYMYYWSRNLWLPILTHMLFNGSQVVIQYLADHGMLGKGFTLSFPYAAAVVSAILMFLSMSWLYRRTMGTWEKTLEKTEE